MSINIFDLKDVSDLPSELRSELNISKRDKFEKNIIQLFKIAGQELNIDQMQAGYFRKYGEHKKRAQINAKLYNMSRASNSAVESVEGKKGTYKLREDFSE